VPFCRCGKKITEKPVHKCGCGRKWLWKMRSDRYVFAGWWTDEPRGNCVCGKPIKGTEAQCECGRKWAYRKAKDRYVFKGGEKVLNIEGVGVTLKYVTPKMVSIRLKCPRCGRDGILVVSSSKEGRVTRYEIKHDMTTCGFGVTSDEFELLDTIYREAKRWER